MFVGITTEFNRLADQRRKTLTDQTAKSKRETANRESGSRLDCNDLLPSFAKDGVTIYEGDCRTILPQLEPESVNCCVTSPPYWGLRDYGCDGQLGLEPTPDEYVANMVDVFTAVRGVLRDDGTVWLNLGDTWNGYMANHRATSINAYNQHARPFFEKGHGLRCKLKNKDLVGIPWRVALALQDDGWYLRQDIIWHKPNPMPESVNDRCTKAHEYVFLLSKSARYHYDAEAIREEDKGTDHNHQNVLDGQPSLEPSGGIRSKHGGLRTVARRNGDGRNKRSVWTVTTKPYPGPHFAVFPEKLIEPCILAGCPEGGVVLDPFLGSGTTAAVAQRNGCKFVGCELNPEYIELATKRFRQRSLLSG